MRPRRQKWAFKARAQWQRTAYMYIFTQPFADLPFNYQILFDVRSSGQVAYTYLTWSWSELFRKQTILYRIWLHAIKILNTTCLVSTHRGGFCIPWSRLLRALTTPLRRTQGVSIFINDTRFPKGDNLKRKQNNFGFINISHKATLAIKKKGIAFRALTSNLNFYTLWPTWWVSH